MRTTEFNEKDHAITFISIVKVLEKKLSVEQFDLVVKEFVNLYGQRRGARMALLAEKTRLQNDIYAYIGCGEYKNSKNSMSQTYSEHVDGTLITISKCPWMDIWEKTGNIRIGKYYCDYIDKALFEGFHGSGQLTVIDTMPNGCQSCQFIYHKLNMNFKAYYKIGIMKAIKPGKVAIRDWAFHIKDLGISISDVLKNHGIMIEDFENMRQFQEKEIRNLTSCSTSYDETPVKDK